MSNFEMKVPDNQGQCSWTAVAALPGTPLSDSVAPKSNVALEQNNSDNPPPDFFLGVITGMIIKLFCDVVLIPYLSPVIDKIIDWVYGQDSSDDSDGGLVSSQSGRDEMGVVHNTFIHSEDSALDYMHYVLQRLQTIANEEPENYVQCLVRLLEGENCEEGSSRITARVVPGFGITDTVGASGPAEDIKPEVADIFGEAVSGGLFLGENHSSLEEDVAPLGQLEGPLL